MDKAMLEKLIIALMDKTFERLEVKDRVQDVNIYLGHLSFISATITDGTSSRNGTWTVTAEEER